MCRLFLSLILLLNLLIAMMSTTYESINERSVLEWRVDFARLILKIELECEWLTKPPRWTCGLIKPWDLHAGERTSDGRYMFYFKNVGTNVEGIEMEGGSEIFGDGLDNFQPPHLAPLPKPEFLACRSAADDQVYRRSHTTCSLPGCKRLPSATISTLHADGHEVAREASRFGKSP